MPQRPKAMVEAGLCRKGLHEWIDGQRQCLPCQREHDRNRVRVYDPEKRSEYNRRWRERHPEKYRESKLKHRYGLTIARWNELLLLQGERCAICQTDEPGGINWHVDHDHACCPTDRTCGKCVRGLLCGKCNQLLGTAKDDVSILAKAIDYINEGGVHGARGDHQAI